MEKHIMRWSYWLGVICAALAVLTRLLNAMGLSSTLLQTRGDSFSFRTFLNAALLFLITSIATAGSIWFKRQNT